MSVNRPILDPVPSGKPHDYQFMRIQMMKGVTELVYPVPYETKEAKLTAERDQQDRGTCVGQSGGGAGDILHIILCKCVPTDADKAQFQKNVVDAIGTIHDVLYRESISAECAYQMSRYIGNVTYPAGSEIRFLVRAWKDYGMVPEDMWHTAKTAFNVWTYPPGVDALRATANGGITQDQIDAEAAKHRIDGYAMCGTPDGGATWDEVCYAIYTQKVVLGAIPVYENYSQMQGGDGTFPDPSGELAGFHALCFYGYDESYLYFLHSWGTWCGRYGKISRKYFDYASDQSVWMVVLDSADTEFGKASHGHLTITTNIPAQLTVNDIVIGITPQTIATVKDTEYALSLSAEGYLTKTAEITGDESTRELDFVLDPAPVPVIKKTWIDLFKEFINWLTNLFKR